MKLFTIGFTKKSAEAFFTKLQQAGVKRLIDVRLNNVSQLAGFTKKDDLRYFARAICGIDYLHLPEFAPTSAILDPYKKAHQHPQIAHLLAPSLYGVHLAALVRFVDHLALPVQRQRLQGLHQHGRFDAGGDLDDEVHVAALRPKPRQVLWGAVQMHVVERVDPVTVALVHDGEDP